MKTNKYVTFEQAKLLKELGYNREEAYCFYEQTVHKKFPVLMPCSLSINDIAAPTLHEATDWLREKGLYTYPKLNALGKWYAVVHFLEYAETVRQEEMFDDFNTALSHGIDYCLSVLKYKEK